MIEAADCLAKTGDALAPSKTRSLCVINTHFEPVFNTAAATQIIFQPLLIADCFQCADNDCDHVFRVYAALKCILDLIDRNRIHCFQIIVQIR